MFLFMLFCSVNSSIFTNSSAEISRALYNCDGTETILSQCSFTIATGVLTHSADAFMSCFISKYKIVKILTHTDGTLEINYQNFQVCR